ncbi:hypothetical protein MASR1M29_23850 [Cloacibacterium normanense]|jgi:ATPase subunit of ABC transporter with duplicated ATPase domains
MNETFTQNQPKKKKSIFKKILIGIGALIAFLILMAILFPLDYYKEGMDAYNKKDYKKAYEYLNNVKPEDKNYSDAIAKINEIKPIVDSLNLAQENAKAEKKAEKENAKLAKAEEKELKENPALDYPAEQQEFISTIQQFSKEYENADNELKKSAIRTKRGEAFKSILKNSRSFNNWVGIVKTMETTSKGKANFGVEIQGTGITLSNMNNELSDMFENTLIEQSSPLYQTISELKKGDKVFVSGDFLKSINNDYIYVLSMTEGGSMENPDFIVKFKEVKK